MRKNDDTGKNFVQQVTSEVDECNGLMFAGHTVCRTRIGQGEGSSSSEQ